MHWEQGADTPFLHTNLKDSRDLHRLQFHAERVPVVLNLRYVADDAEVVMQHRLRLVLGTISLLCPGNETGNGREAQ